MLLKVREFQIYYWADHWEGMGTPDLHLRLSGHHSTNTILGIHLCEENSWTSGFTKFKQTDAFPLCP